ncbi:MAG: hypothetical protein Q8K40_05595, partial [Ignavibacteria bacterium]|nr:hypothetical protein [Ignavibacteria bacterium]
MIKNIVCLFTFTLLVAVLQAQTQFIQQGRVEFEQKINQHTPLEDDADNIWNAERMKVIPKFVTDVFELRFNLNKSVY